MLGLPVHEGEELGREHLLQQHDVGALGRGVASVVSAAKSAATSIGEIVAKKVVNAISAVSNSMSPPRPKLAEAATLRQGPDRSI